MFSQLKLRNLLLTCGLLLGAALISRGIAPIQPFDLAATRLEASASTRSVHVPSNSADYTTRKIEEIAVGDRVVTGISKQMREVAVREINPLPAWDDFEIAPAEWRRVELMLTRDDGSQMHIVLLRPLEWLRDNCVEPDRTVPISLPEMRQQGLATIKNVSDCPLVVPGDGAVVTGTFASTVRDVLEIHLEDSSEPIACTAEHPFYLRNQDRFIAASEIRVGDQFTGIRGSARVRAVTLVRGKFRVHNLEVQGDHVFRVAAQGVLVHNTWTPPFGAKPYYHYTDFPEEAFSSGFRPNSWVTDNSNLTVDEAMLMGLNRPPDKIIPVGNYENVFKPGPTLPGSSQAQFTNGPRPIPPAYIGPAIPMTKN